MASEQGTAQTDWIYSVGVAGPVRCRTGELKPRVSQMSLERATIAGDSPVGENKAAPDGFLSTTGHVKSGGNLGRPLSKAKYSLATDSEQVPRGKGEKNP